MRRRTTAQERFFYVRSMVSPCGRAVQEGFGPAGSYARSANLHGFALPAWRLGGGSIKSIGVLVCLNF